MSDFIKHNAIKNTFKVGDSWAILSEIERSIKTKIEAVGIPLRNWGIKINYGIKTGCNEAFIIDEEKRRSILDTCTSEDERIRTDKIIRPILRGRDINRDGYKWAGLYCILAYFDFHKEISLYPSIHGYLKQYELKLRNRGQVRYTSSGKPKDGADYPGQHHWLELDNNPRKEYMDDFSKQRFIWTAVNSEYRFLAINEEIYYNNSIFHGVSDKAIGISSVMNSGIMRFYMIMLSSDNYQYGGKNLMETIPLPKNIENIIYTDEMLRDIYQLTNDEMNFISSSLSPISE